MNDFITLSKVDMDDLSEWAETVADRANVWAARAEKSRGERGELARHLDGIAREARMVANMAHVINAR